MSQLKAKAQKATHNQRHMFLALQSAQITNNAHINLNFNLSNPSSSYSAGASPDATGCQTSSVETHLRNVFQNTEPKSNCKSAAPQPHGNPDRTSTQIMEHSPVHPKFISSIIDEESHSPEEGEIQQQISSTGQEISDMTAAHTISSPNITAFKEIPSLANDQCDSDYYVQNNYLSSPTLNSSANNSTHGHFQKKHDQ
jgi:hypothetical protein